jgi:hypothetical protein
MQSLAVVLHPARHRAKLCRPSQATPRAPASRLPPRPKRWAAAVATLADL